MKKWISGCAKAGLAVLVLGMVLTVVGIVLGGSVSDVSLPGWNWSETEKLEMTAGAGTKHLEITADLGTVELVTEAGTDQIRVEGRGFHGRQDGDTLELHSDEIRAKKTWTAKLLRLWQAKEENMQPSLTVYMPENMKLKTISVEVDAGQITADELRAEILELEVDMGEIEIRQGETDVLEASCEMGGISYTGQIGRSAVLDCEMGEINLLISGAETDFNYEADCEIGSIFINGNKINGIRAQQSSDRPMAPKTMKLDCEMGNISVRFR